MNFDKAVQIIYELKSIRLSELLSEEAEVKKDFIRAELSQLDEEKRFLYSLDIDDIELFIQKLSDKYRLIQS
ncbi:MAG: hypothetical protein U5N85_14060 [Arcicella sp.]|nr:hypothetical protein [Arcicella sp.]